MCKAVIMSGKTRECPNFSLLADVEALYKQEVKALRKSYKLSEHCRWPTTHIESCSKGSETAVLRQVRKSLSS